MATTTTITTTSFDQRRYRPLGVSDLFDEAFDLYKSNFALFLGAAAIIFVPLNVLMLAIVYPVLEQGSTKVAAGGFDYDQIMAFLGQATGELIVASVVYGLFYILLSGALILVVAQRYLNRPATLVWGYRQAMRRALPLTLAVLVAMIPVIAGHLLCLLPGIYIFCRYIYLPQVVMLEPGLGPIGAIKRTWRLTKDHFWQIAGLLTLLSLISWALSAALQIPIYIVLNWLPLDSFPFLPALAAHRNLADQIAAAFSGLLLSPFSFALLTVAYYDLRIRQEGYDMVILSEQLGFTGPTGGALPQAPLPGGPKTRGPRFWQRRSRTPGAAA